jgi:hypothetical protein
MMFRPDASRPRAPRLAAPAVLVLALLGLVLGTYGTARGGADFSGTVYAGVAVPGLVALAAGVALWHLARRRGAAWHRILAPELLCLTAAVLWMGLGMLVVGRPSTSTVFTIGASLMVPTAIVASATGWGRGDAAVRWVAQGLVVAGALAVGTGIWSIVVGPLRVGPLLIEYNPLYFRMNAWFNNSTMLGLFLAHALFAGAYFRARTTSQGGRVAWALLMGLLVLGMVLSGGRTGVVVAVVVAGFTTLAKAPRRLGPTLRLAALAFVLLATAAIVLSAFGDSIYLVRRFTDPEALLLGDRDQFAADAVRALVAAPWTTPVFGLGANGVAEVLRWPVGAHSGVVRIALEHGLPTLAFLGLGVAIASARLVPGIRDEALGPEREFVLRSLVAFAIAELTVIQLLGVDVFHVLFCVMLGLAVALAAPDRHQRSPHPATIDFTT